MAPQGENAVLTTTERQTWLGLCYRGLDLLDLLIRKVLSREFALAMIGSVAVSMNLPLLLDKGMSFEWYAGFLLALQVGYQGLKSYHERKLVNGSPSSLPVEYWRGSQTVVTPQYSAPTTTRPEVPDGD